MGESTGRKDRREIPLLHQGGEGTLYTKSTGVFNMSTSSMVYGGLRLLMHHHFAKPLKRGQPLY